MFNIFLFQIQGGCPTADDYLGYDQTLSLCKCKVDDLQEICDLECRLAQRNRITLVCADPPYVCINYPVSKKVRFYLFGCLCMTS